MAKLTRKSYKRKKVAFAAILLGGVALVSSGFAAWVLSAQADQSNQGSVNVGSVVNGALTMNLYHYDDSKTDKKGELITKSSDDKPAAIDEYFSFNPKDTDLPENGKENRVYWKESVEGEKPENLSNKFVVEIKSKTDSLSTLNISLLTDKDSGFANVKNGAFIVKPSCYSKDGQTISKTAITWNDSEKMTDEHYSLKVNSTDGYTWIFIYEVKFEWGGRFANENPADFFDDKEKKSADTSSTDSVTDGSVTYGKGYGDKTGYTVDMETIDRDLTYLHDQVDGAKYTIKFTATGM